MTAHAQSVGRRSKQRLEHLSGIPLFAFTEPVFGFGNERPKDDVQNGFEHSKKLGRFVIERFGANRSSEMSESSFHLRAFFFAGKTNHDKGGVFFGRKRQRESKEPPRGS